MLKTRRASGDVKLDNLLVILSAEKQAVIIKKGKSDGKTHAKKRLIPSKTLLERVGESAKYADSIIKMQKRNSSTKEFSFLVI